MVIHSMWLTPMSMVVADALVVFAVTQQISVINFAALPAPETDRGDILADIPVDGQTRVSWVPTIANIAAPTTTELNAGILLQSLLTADGLVGFEPDTADVDNTSLASTFDTLTIGRDSFKGTMLRLKKQLTGDTTFTTLTRGTAGYVVIRRDIAETTAWTSAQAVEVYPVILGQRRRLAPQSNTVTRYEVPTKVQSLPSLTAVIP